MLTDIAHKINIIQFQEPVGIVDQDVYKRQVAARFQAPGLVEEMQIDEVERIFQIMAGEYRLLYAKERDWLL